MCYAHLRILPFLFYVCYLFIYLLLHVILSRAKGNILFVFNKIGTNISIVSNKNMNKAYYLDIFTNYPEKNGVIHAP